MVISLDSVSMYNDRFLDCMVISLDSVSMYNDRFLDCMVISLDSVSMYNEPVVVHGYTIQTCNHTV
jgi:hypothetical protein